MGLDTTPQGNQFITDVYFNCLENDFHINYTHKHSQIQRYREVPSPPLKPVS